MTVLAITPNPGTSPFDDIMEFDTDGTPVWRARRLMALMGYPRWSDFQRVLARAMAAAKNTDMEVSEVFRASTENPSERGGRPREDFKLNRDAAYLTALNGDPNKDEVAGAQRYFVAQTRKQEIAEQPPRVVQVAAPADDDLAAIEHLVRVVRAERHRVAVLEAAQAQQSQRQHVIEARMDGIEARHDWFAALAYAKMNGLATERGFLQRLGIAATRVTKRLGHTPAKMQHPLYGSVNTYPIAALDEAVELLGGAA